MAEATDRSGMLIQNLEDAGCEQADIARFLQLEQEGRRPELLRFLRAHRTTLLNRLHVSQRQIDCLDYLIYQMDRG